MTRYGRSPWIDTFPRTRVPSYPPFKGSHDIDAVVIGGGLTGCATAYAFAAAGVKVALIEAAQIGRGASGLSAGVIASDPGASFLDTEKLLGRRSARSAWQAWRRSALDFAALLRRLDVRCDLQPRNALLVATSPDQALRLRKEQAARTQAGLEAPALTAKAAAAEAALAALGGIRTRDAATLDPYRAAIGLAAAASARGALIFERTPVKRTRFTRRTADVITGGGAIRTRRIIVATGVPTALFSPLARHFWFHSSFAVLTEPIPAKVRRQLGKPSLIVRDLAVPAHLVRWYGADRLLISGADAAALEPRLAEKAIVQRTGQLMYELSTMYPEISGIMPAYGWTAPYARTAEGVPYIGPHRNYPFHLFAFGDASRSVTGAYLASRILLRYHLGDTDAVDDAFGFNR